MIEQYLEILGHRVRDTVTGFEGVAEAVEFTLYGCVQAIVRPPFPPGEDSEKHKAMIFDHKRLQIVDSGAGPVMAKPTFASVPGPIDQSTIVRP